MTGEIRFLTHDGLQLAYSVLSHEGPPVLFVPSWFTSIATYAQSPSDYLRRLTSFCRLASYDQPGTGLSDTLPANVDLGMETWLGALDAVIEELGWEQATLHAFDISAMVACEYATRRPDRISSLILDSPVPGFGMYGREQREAMADAFAATFGTPQDFEFFAPGSSGDEELAREWNRRRHQAIRPSAVRRITRAAFELDARHALPNVRCPVLVLHSIENPTIPIGAGRYVAQQIPGATLVELPGVSGVLPIRPEDIERRIVEIRRFLLGHASAVQLGRVLTTVLFTDIVSSTSRTAELGDKGWGSVMDRHNETVRETLSRYGGRLVETTGDGILATIDSPARGVRCAQALVVALHRLDIEIRAGLHTGEVEIRGDGIGGMAVNIARRVCDSAEANEVRVSESVVLVVAGSGLEFDELGSYELKGVPGRRRLYCARY